MLTKIKEFLKQVFTEPNNQTPCVARLFGVAALVQGQALVAYQVIVQHTTFDYQSYALGTAAMFTGLGVILGLKKDSQ